MIRLVFLPLFALLCFLTAAPQPVQACVGKTLHIASAGSPQQEILANALATLISERTGTTVKVVTLSSQQVAHDALLKAEIDLAVEYTAFARNEILRKPAITDPKSLLDAVREDYNQNLNLVWLAPFGFVDAKNGQGTPVARKDTLKKFPALARLINKLGNTIDETTMQKLESQLRGGRTAQDVARTFLKDNRLI